MPALHYLLFALSLLGPFSASSNFSADLMGPADTRMAGQLCAGSPCIWGNADSTVWPLTFKAPAGMRVRILRLRGDLVAWPKVMAGQPAVAPGRYAGILVGFQTSDPDGSTRCDYCADNTMIYFQDAVSDRPTRIPYDVTFTTGNLLAADNKLLIKVASWLNTTGYPIHMEPTFTVEYRFEPAPER